MRVMTTRLGLGFGFGVYEGGEQVWEEGWLGCSEGIEGVDYEEVPCQLMLVILMQRKCHGTYSDWGLVWCELPLPAAMSVGSGSRL